MLQHCVVILEVAENAKASTAIVHIERNLEDIDAAFEKMKSDITNNITEIDQQKRKFLSDISDMHKSFSLVGKLAVVFLVSCDVTPSLFSCGICACNSTSFTRVVTYYRMANFYSLIKKANGC
jgi:hypothetical protein